MLATVYGSRSLLMNILDAPNVGVSLFFPRLESSSVVAVCVVFRLRMPMNWGRWCNNELPHHPRSTFNSVILISECMTV